MKNLPLIQAHSEMSMIQVAIAQLAKDTEGDCKSQDVVLRLDAIAVAVSEMQHGLQRYRADILEDAIEFEHAPGKSLNEPVALPKPISDDDFSEPLPPPQCKIDDPACEACQ